MASKAMGGRRGPVPSYVRDKMVAEGHVTIAEAAAFLTVHPSTVRDYVANGSLSFVQLGSRIAIPRRALHKFAESLYHQGRVA